MIGRGTIQFEKNVSKIEPGRAQTIHSDVKGWPVRQLSVGSSLDISVACMQGVGDIQVQI